MALGPHEIELHGHPVGYRRAGDGPALLLLHAITDSSATCEGASESVTDHWRPLMTGDG
jgi:hypothetical protein